MRTGIMQENSGAGWSNRNHKELSTREIAGFQNIYRPDKFREQPYSVEKQGVVQKDIQTVLTPKEGNGITIINGNAYITASVVGNGYPKHGVWLLLDKETLEPILLEHEGKKYMLVSIGNFTAGKDSKKENYNAQLWQVGSKGQFATPGNIEEREGSIRIQSIYKMNVL